MRLTRYSKQPYKHVSLNTGSSIKPKKYNTKNGNNAKTQHGKQEKYINKIISKTPPNEIKYNNELATLQIIISQIK